MRMGWPRQRPCWRYCEVLETIQQRGCQRESWPRILSATKKRDKMPDEKLMKSIVEAQKKLQPLIDAVEASRRHLQPLQDAMRVIEQNSALEKMLKNIDL